MGDTSAIIGAKGRTTELALVKAASTTTIASECSSYIDNLLPRMACEQKSDLTTVLNALWAVRKILPPHCNSGLPSSPPLSTEAAFQRAAAIERITIHQAHRAETLFRFCKRLVACIDFTIYKSRLKIWPRIRAHNPNRYECRS